MLLIRHALAFAVALSFCCVLVVESGAGNCTQPRNSVSLTSPSGGTVLENFGAWGTLSSAINGQIQPESLNVNVSVLGLAERNRTYSTRSCLTPTGLGSSIFSVYDDRDRPYAPLHRFFDIEDYNCYTYRHSEFINGTRIDGLYTRMTYPSEPTFNVLFSYEFAHAEVQFFPSEDTTYTTGRQYSYHWRPDRLKVTTEMTGMPWNQSLSANFVSVHFQAEVFIQPGGTATFSDYNVTNVAYNTTNQLLEFEFEKCFLVDGTPYCSEQTYAYGGILGPFLLGANIKFPIGVAICDEAFTKWSQAIYDPQFASVFLSARTPDSPPLTPSLANRNRAVQIAVPVVVGVILVAIIAFVILVFNVPVLKAKFTPARLTTMEARSSPDPKVPSSSSSSFVPSVSPTTIASAPTPSQPTASPAHVSGPTSGGWTKVAKPQH